MEPCATTCASRKVRVGFGRERLASLSAPRPRGRMVRDGDHTKGTEMSPMQPTTLSSSRPSCLCCVVGSVGAPRAAGSSGLIADPSSVQCSERSGGGWGVDLCSMRLAPESAISSPSTFTPADRTDAAQEQIRDSGRRVDSGGITPCHTHARPARVDKRHESWSATRIVS